MTGEKQSTRGDRNEATADGEILELENFVPYRMLMATDQVTQLYEVRYEREFGISIPESRVINVLSQFAPVSSWEVCERTAMSKPRVSAAISRLEARGLLRRDVNSGDKRLLRLQLTAKGKSLYKKIVPVALDMERRLTETLSKEDRATLMSLLNGIEAKAKREMAEERGRDRSRTSARYAEQDGAAG